MPKRSPKDKPMAEKPFTLQDLRRVLKLGRTKAEAREQSYKREEKFLLPDMVGDDKDYEGDELGGVRIYNTKCADFVDADTRFTFQHALKSGKLNIRMYLNDTGKRQVEELGYNPDKVQEQINRNVEVIAAALEDADPYTALRRHWRQGFVRGTSVIVTERNPNAYGNFEVSPVNLRNVVIGGAMKLPKGSQIPHSSRVCPPDRGQRDYGGTQTPLRG